MQIEAFALHSGKGHYRCAFLISDGGTLWVVTVINSSGCTCVLGRHKVQKTHSELLLQHVLHAVNLGYMYDHG